MASVRMHRRHLRIPTDVVLLNVEKRKESKQTNHAHYVHRWHQRDEKQRAVREETIEVVRLRPHRKRLRSMPMDRQMRFKHFALNALRGLDDRNDSQAMQSCAHHQSQAFDTQTSYITLETKI